jgi:SAM-dependent methyltransferase
MSDADSKQRFTPRVADYVAGRPAYPRAVIDTLAARVGFAPDWSVVDVGAGTGISCRLFLENGNAVTAVEPNDAMRSAAGQSLAAFPNFTAINAPAEATTLPGESADLVVAAQAFHWFDRDAFAAECLRLLTSRGYVCLMWNDRDLSSPFVAEYEKVCERYATDYSRVGHRKMDSEPLAESWFLTEGYFAAELPNPQTATWETIEARIASSSYMPQRGDANYDPMRRDLRAAFDQHQQNGVVPSPLITRLHVGRPVI